MGLAIVDASYEQVDSQKGTVDSFSISENSQDVDGITVTSDSGSQPDITLNTFSTSAQLLEATEPAQETVLNGELPGSVATNPVGNNLNQGSSSSSSHRRTGGSESTISSDSPKISATFTEFAVVNVDGHLVELGQFRITNPFAPHCFVYHYHASVGESVTALDGEVIDDPDPDGCGYGAIGSLGAGDILLNSAADEDFDGLPDSLEVELVLDPSDPDTDGDLVIDFHEDTDQDGAENGEELADGTDASKADQDNNGVNDGIQRDLEKLRTTFTKVPVIINILKNSEADLQNHIIEAIKRANIVLKTQLNIMLKPVKANIFAVNGPDDGSGGGTAGDGTIRFDGSGNDEYNKVARHGERELNKSNQTAGKGIKITVANQSQTVKDGKTYTTPGSSAENVRTILVTQRGENNNSTSIDLTASTIIHEFGHTFGLKHPKVTASTADDTPGNAMTPSDSLRTRGDGLGRDDFVKSTDPNKGLTKVSLTDEQKSKVVRSGKLERWGIQAATRSPAEATHYQFGSSDDDSGDQIGTTAGYVDIFSVSMDSLQEEENINTVIFVNQKFPDPAPFDVTFSIGFDTDADPTTGSPIPSFTGIEKEVVIHIFRENDMGEIQTYAIVADHSTFQNSVIFEPLIIQTVEHQGDLVDDEPAAYTDELILRIPKDMLSFSAEDIPVTIITRDLADSFFPFAIFDSSSLVFDTDLFTEMPRFDINQEFAEPGESVPFEVSGLAPNLQHQLLLDETKIMDFDTDSNGHFDGIMTIPPTIEEEVYFLTAENDANQTSAEETAAIFAFSVIRITPPSEPRIYDLQLFEGSNSSDGVLILGEQARAVAETDDNKVDAVTFRWIDPSGNEDRTISVTLGRGSAEDAFMPDEVGTWTIEADFGNGLVIQETLHIDFLVIPESPIGLIALIASSLAVLGGFLFLKRRSNTSNGMIGRGI
jgi:hypothetical protein